MEDTGEPTAINPSKVAIFTTPTCGYCKMAKEYFKDNKVQYEEYDVAVDAQKRQEMFDRTHQMGVPVIQIGDQFVVGFDKPKVEQLLKAQEDTIAAS